MKLLDAPIKLEIIQIRKDTATIHKIRLELEKELSK